MVSSKRIGKPLFVSCNPLPRAISTGPVLVAHAELSMQDPFPAFSPVLCTALPGCVLFNTGDAICALHYTLSPGAVCCGWASIASLRVSNANLL
jgi:hypothetical protein